MLCSNEIPTFVTSSGRLVCREPFCFWFFVNHGVACVLNQIDRSQFFCLIARNFFVSLAVPAAFFLDRECRIAAFGCTLASVPWNLPNVVASKKALTSRLYLAICASKKLAAFFLDRECRIAPFAKIREIAVFWSETLVVGAFVGIGEFAKLQFFGRKP